MRISSVRLLVEHGAELRQRCLESALSYGQANIVKALLEMGMKLVEKGEFWKTK